MSRSHLVSKDSLTTRPFSVRLPAALAERLDAIKTRANERGFKLDVTPTVVESLERLVREVERELTVSAHAPQPIARAQPNNL